MVIYDLFVGGCSTYKLYPFNTLPMFLGCTTSFISCILIYLSLHIATTLKNEPISTGRKKYGKDLEGLSGEEDILG